MLEASDNSKPHSSISISSHPKKSKRTSLSFLNKVAFFEQSHTFLNLFSAKLNYIHSASFTAISCALISTYKFSIKALLSSSCLWATMRWLLYLQDNWSSHHPNHDFLNRSHLLHEGKPCTFPLSAPDSKLYHVHYSTMCIHG